MAAVSAPLQRPGPASVVWQALRPYSLTVAVVPAVVGTAALVADRSVRPLTALACLTVAVLLQAATNSVNDAEDNLSGADRDHPLAGSSLPMRQGWVTAHDAHVIGAVCLGLAAALGVLTALAVGRPALLLLGLLGMAIAWAYTAPPLRLAYRPLGELASGLPMGLGILWGTAAAQTDSIPRSVYWAAAPLALLTAGILHANNARDREHDRGVGKRTLATYLSPTGVVWEMRVLTGLVPIVLVAGLATRGLPWECVLALAPGALAARTAVRTSTHLDALGWTHQLLACVKLHLLTGVALTAGLLLGAIG